MSLTVWTWLFIGLSFALFLGMAFWAQTRSIGDFYVAERQVHPIMNGMATGAEWISAASFLSMAGMISFMGRDGSMFLMGWTGGYVLLAMLLAPYLREYGKFTVPEFVGDRYYSSAARVVALLCAILISFVYAVAQMRGVVVVFARYMNIDLEAAVFMAALAVFFFTAIGGMKGITFTQVAQYLFLIIAFIVPAVFIGLTLTGSPIPQLAYGGTLTAEGAAAIGQPAAKGRYLLDVLDGLNLELGFSAYTKAGRPLVDTFAVTLALMVGTAGLPHIISRFFTVRRIADARSAAGWALLFIAVLFTSAPAVGAFARLNFVKAVNGVKYAQAPGWFTEYEKAGLVAWVDKNSDGVITYGPGRAFEGSPAFTGERGSLGQRLVGNAPGEGANEIHVDNDIMVLANPEISGLPNWVIALVAAGGLAAALSTAAGLLLVISSAVSHDLIKGVLAPHTTEREEIRWARTAALVAVVGVSAFCLRPPGHIAEIVALAFGFAASSFFPVIVLGIFWTKTTKEGAIAGMITGVAFTGLYVLLHKYLAPGFDQPGRWLLGISPEGIGSVGMLLNFAVCATVSRFTRKPPAEVQELVESLRYPRID